MTAAALSCPGNDPSFGHSPGDPRAGLPALLQADGYVGLPFDLPDLFVPEVVDPAAILNVLGPVRTSMHVLQVQVLLDAIRIVLRGRRADGRRHRGLYAETVTWFGAADEWDAWPLTFLNVCDSLGLSAPTLRRLLFEPARARPRVRRHAVAGTRTAIG